MYPMEKVGLTIPISYLGYTFVRAALARARAGKYADKIQQVLKARSSFWRVWYFGQE